ncbi:MAG: hypothetical protein ACTSU5_07580 [Promethearchaeota archaeon]
MEKPKNKKVALPIIFLCIGMPIFAVGLIRSVSLPEPYLGFSYNATTIDEVTVNPNNFVTVTSAAGDTYIVTWQDYSDIYVQDPSQNDQILAQTNVLVLSLQMELVANATLYGSAILRAVALTNGRVMIVTREIQKIIDQRGLARVEVRQDSDYQILVAQVPNLHLLPGYPLKPAANFPTINTTHPTEYDAWKNVHYFNDLKGHERIFTAFGMDCAMFYVNNASMASYLTGDDLDTILGINYSKYIPVPQTQNEYMTNETNWVPIEVGASSVGQTLVIRQRSAFLGSTPLGWNTTRMGVFNVTQDMELVNGTARWIGEKT